MAKGMRSLAEFHIQAVRRSLSLTGELRYRFVDPNTHECWNTQVLKKEGKIFSFYRSFSALETEKPPNVPRRFMIIAGLSILVILVGGYYGIVKRLTRPSKLAVSEADAAERKPKSKTQSTVGSQNVEMVTSANNSRSNDTGGLLKSDSRFMVIVGHYTSDDLQTFLVSLGTVTVKLTADELVSTCGCHADRADTGMVFQINPNTAPASIKAALQAPGGPAIQSPASLGGKVTL